MKGPIDIRAHHLLCIPRFYRGGYDQEFAENMKGICQRIRKNPSIKIRILVGELDDLCRKCPHKSENECAQSEKIGKWVVSQDEKTAKFLKISPNETYAAKDVFSLSMEKVNPKTISKACRGCFFIQNCIKVGINDSFRRDLKKG